MQFLADFLNQFLDIIYNSLSWVFDALIQVVPFILLLVLEGFFTVIGAFISAIDVGNLAVNAAATWGLLPQGIAYLVSISGIPTGLSMLSLAWLIRFTLNIIPAAFTRI